MLPVPLFISGKTTHEQWLTMLSTLTNVPDVVLVSNRAIIVCQLYYAAKFQDEDQQALLNQIDQVYSNEEAIMGLDGSSALNAPRLHRLLMTQHSNPSQYMYALGSRTAYRTSTLDVILTMNGITVSGWGAWHEIGHTYQQNWKWDALGEVTNNIYSLKAQRAFGNPSRLKTDNTWAKAVTFLAQPDATRNFNVSTSDVMVRLCMFQQLYLAFGEQFYITQHKTYRLEKPTLADETAKMRWFMINACKTSSKNLGGFFKKWGLIVPASVYTEIDALGYPAPATDLTLLKD
jgi:hypothetical protein